ncbi:cysteine desulfurase NifS, partial [Acidobacteriota bacterium]
MGLGAACEIARPDLAKNMKHMQQARDLLHQGIEKEAGPLKLNGHPQKRLPNTLSLGFRGIEADTL